MKLKTLTNKQRNLSEKLFLETVSFNGICRIFDVRMPWLLDFINFIIHDLPEDLNAQVTCREKEELEMAKLEGNERWSFVGNKKNDQWLWLIFHKKVAKCLLSKWVLEIKKPLSFFLQNDLNPSKESPLFH